MLNIKKINRIGCTFIGKPIKNHPEMGVVVGVREIVLDEKDFFDDWLNHEEVIELVKTDTGFVFPATLLADRVLEIGNYAPIRMENDVELVW